MDETPVEVLLRAIRRAQQEVTEAKVRLAMAEEQLIDAKRSAVAAYGTCDVARLRKMADELDETIDREVQSVRVALRQALGEGSDGV